MENISYSNLTAEQTLNAVDRAPHFRDIFHQHTAESYSLAIDQAKEMVLKFLENQQKPFSGITPLQLGEQFNKIEFDVPLASYDELFSEVQELYVDHATAFHLPNYIAHLNCPVVIPALAAEVLISAINSSQDTWDQSAGGTLMERQLINWTAQQIGFGDRADGVFTGGGSQSNLMGLLLARDYFALNRLNHNIKVDGNPPEASRFRVFVSDKSHFSNQKNASLLGLGEQGVIQVATDGRFKMKPDALEEAIRNELQLGNIPFAIVATAGTTDFGNVDPLEAISALAAKYKLWMHVDAAYGCGLLLTDQHKHLLAGIEKADSVTIDYHKSFFQPISSSAFIVRDKNSLEIIKHHADYLNPKEQDYEEYPAQINKSITQSTRRFDALKLWFTLRLLGREKLGEYMNAIISTAKEAADLITRDPELELLSDSDISVLVFRYRSLTLKHVDLSALNQYIKKKMFHTGEVLVASTKVNGSFYLKFTIFNPITTVNDIKNILGIIKTYGAAYPEH